MHTLKAIRDALLDFLSDLRAALPNEDILVLFYHFMKHSAPIGDVAEYIVQNIVPLEDFVTDRRDDYFIRNAVFFERLGNYEGEVNYFANLWQASNSEEDKNTVWQWLEEFIRLGKEHAAAASIVIPPKVKCNRAKKRARIVRLEAIHA